MKVNIEIKRKYSSLQDKYWLLEGFQISCILLKYSFLSAIENLNIFASWVISIKNVCKNNK